MINFVFNITLLSPGIIKERYSYQLLFSEDYKKLLSLLFARLSMFAYFRKNMFEKVMYEHNTFRFP